MTTRYGRITMALAGVLAAQLFCGVSRADEKANDAIEAAIAVLDNVNAQVVRTVLDNGMICLVREDRTAPVVALQLWIATGSIHEQEYLGSGLSHGIEHMIFKGTDKREVGRITRDISDAGGDINAYTSLDRTVFHTDLPSRNWLVGLDVLADAVMNAEFPEDEWKKEKQVILREFAMNKDDPDRVLDKLLWATAFAVHPYRYPVIGYEGVFKKLTRADLVRFARRNYVPDNMIMVVVGDVDAVEAAAAVRGAFAGFDRKARAPIVLPSEPLQIAPRMVRRTGPYKVSRLQWSYHTIPLNHPDLAALDILAEIVGSGTSSRLVSGIKEKKKLVHSIGAGSHNLREAGVFEIDATFDPAKEDGAVDAILAEINAWMTDPFSSDEVAKAQRMLLTSELSELQTVKGQAQNYASGEFYAQNPGFSATYLKHLSRVTPEAVQAVARKYLQPENRTLALLTPQAGTGKVEKAAAAATALPEKSVLSNGACLLMREDHRLPFVYFCVSLGGGLLAEDESNTGITKLMSSLLISGTEKRSRLEIAGTVDSLGGMLAPYSGYNGFGLQARCLTADRERFIEIIADCLLNAQFPEEEVEKQKKIQLSQIDEEHERPSVIAQEALREALFPGHPYRWNPTGKKETVSKLQRAAIEEHFARLVVSGNIVFAVFGDIKGGDVKDMMEKHFSNLRKGQSPMQPRVRSNPSLPTRMERREPHEQAVVLAGFPGVDVKDPKSDALILLETAMSGLSSDLGLAVREKRGLAYYIGAYQQSGVEPGAFIIYAGTREDAVDEVEKQMRKEVKRLASKGLRDDEVARAKNQLVSEFEMGLQDNLGTAMRCALDELYGLGYMHFLETRKRFEAVTTEDIRAAASSVLVPGRMALSVVLPGGKAEGE